MVKINETIEEMEYGKFQIGAQALIIKDNCVLLGLRKKTFGGGYWGLPGGRLKPEETLIQALKREVQEELGILLDEEDCELVCVADPKPENNFQPQIGFLIKESNIEPINNEPDKCEKLEWFPLNRLPENISVASKPLLDKFIAQKIY